MSTGDNSFSMLILYMRRKERSDSSEKGSCKQEKA